MNTKTMDTYQESFNELIEEGGIRLYPSLIQANPDMSTPSWLIFANIGKAIMPKQSKVYNTNLVMLQAECFPWMSIKAIGSCIAELIDSGYISDIGSMMGRSLNCFGFTPRGMDVYCKECIEAGATYISIHPELVETLGGLGNTIILTRLHYAFYQKDNITCSVNNMHTTFFKDMFSESTLKRGIKELTDSEFLIRFPNSGENNQTLANSYIINYDLILCYFDSFEFSD